MIAMSLIVGGIQGTLKNDAGNGSPQRDVLVFNEKKFFLPALLRYN